MGEVESEYDAASPMLVLVFVLEDNNQLVDVVSWENVVDEVKVLSLVGDQVVSVDS